MKRLLLLGGGHAHVHVLKTLADAPLAGVEITLLSPYARQVYSGMLPGWIAGHYRLEECVIPLRPLCERAGVNFVETAAESLDLSHRLVRGADGSETPFDLLSIDTGPVADMTMVPGAAEHAIAVRPIESFIDAFDRLAANIDARAQAGQSTHIAFVGAGAAGIELALAMQYAFRRKNASFTLISAANTLPGGVGPRIARVMRERDFGVLAGQAASRIEAGRVLLQNGATVEADHLIFSTGATAAAWPRESGLKTDDRGFILVNDYLQSVSHPEVFAAGDCATMINHARPKSGVYAVRGGPPLAENLRLALLGDGLQRYSPQKRSLYLISTGDQYAIASWGAWSWQGAWVWRWKDRIDREFMRKYSM
jgi:pyridine nucleotide-disulfide oxidoreductase family protein